jgi:peroxiredoxin Q/BCP
MTRLQQGDPAPPFELEDQAERLVRLSDFRGRKLLLYFYPEADSPGCAAQAGEVRDARADLLGLGVDVAGVSPDLPAEQKAFDEKLSLGFPLLSDPDHAVADAYGVWGERSMYGKTSVGIIRSSFLIDEEGRIERAWYEVTPMDTVPNARAALASQET